MRLLHRTDIRGFGDMVRHIRQRSDRATQEILDAEAKTILQGMVRRSVAASRASIVRRVDSKEWATYRGKKYRIGGKGKYGKQKTDHANRYPDLIWAGIVSLKRQRLADKLIARGLLKQSWAQVADELGLALNVPGFVRAAKSARRGRVQTGRGFRGGLVRSPTITIVNNSKVAEVTGGRRLLSQVMASRVRQYRRGIQEEFRRIAQAGAARNPGAKVT